MVYGVVMWSCGVSVVATCVGTQQRTAAGSHGHTSEVGGIRIRPDRQGAFIHLCALVTGLEGPDSHGQYLHVPCAVTCMDSKPFFYEHNPLCFQPPPGPSYQCRTPPPTRRNRPRPPINNRHPPGPSKSRSASKFGKQTCLISTRTALRRYSPPRHPCIRGGPPAAVCTAPQLPAPRTPSAPTPVKARITNLFPDFARIVSRINFPLAASPHPADRTRRARWQIQRSPPYPPPSYSDASP